MAPNSKYKARPKKSKSTGSNEFDFHYLILHNDDVNTFEHVIESLIEICHHDSIQAEQCTFIIHFKGKCDIKAGNFEDLNSMKKELKRRGLKATIE